LAAEHRQQGEKTEDGQRQKAGGNHLENHFPEFQEESSTQQCDYENQDGVLHDSLLLLQDVKTARRFHPNQRPPSLIASNESADHAK
jgi:hypothetical protein